jgi:hypothetical protein
MVVEQLDAPMSAQNQDIDLAVLSWRLYQRAAAISRWQLGCATPVKGTCLINNRTLHGRETDSGGWSDDCKCGSLRDRDDDYPVV